MRDFITAALLVGLIGSAQAFQNRPPMTDAEASAAADTVISTCNLPSSKQVAARVLTRIYDWQTIQTLVLMGRSMQLLNSNKVWRNIGKVLARVLAG